jgi:tryptophanyl-tRNA synthetase
MSSSTKKTLLSGVKPTCIPTLGNYIGAVNNWRRLQDEYNCFFPVVDLHAITEPIDPKILYDNTMTIAATYLACGISPDHSAIFVQSHLMEHAQLAWMLTCQTGMGELGRMTQYKDKLAKQESSIRAGLFSYPILMAADILLYDTHVVPVGEDQKQHVELTRDLAQRLNASFGEGTVVMPEPVIPKVGARIMDLQNPTAKMSKSDVEGKGVIFLLDSDKEILKKIKSAVTDSGSEIRFAEDKPGVSNLLTIHSVLSGKSITQLEQEYASKMYGHLKVDTAELAVSVLGPIRENIIRLTTTDRGYLDELLAKGAARARERAAATLKRISASIGFYPPRG